MKINIRIMTAIILVFVCGSMVLGAGEDKKNDRLWGSGSTTLLEKPTHDTDLADDNLGGSLYRMMLSLAVVIALAIGVMYVSRRVLPKVSGISGKRVQVLESVSLGSRRSVHLVAVGDRQILIGSTQNTITRLAELSAEELKVPETDCASKPRGEEK